jgi:hypothetical protein
MKRLFSFRSVFSRLFASSSQNALLESSWPPIESTGAPVAPAEKETPAEHPDVNPIVEQLLNAQTDAERAQWLLHVPLSFIVKRHEEVRDALSDAGYRNGLNYVDVLLAVLSMRRDADGFHSLAMSRCLDRAAVLVRLDVRPDRTLMVEQRIGRILGVGAAGEGSEKA